MDDNAILKEMHARVTAGRRWFGTVVAAFAVLALLAMMLMAPARAHADEGDCTGAIKLPVNVLYVNAGLEKGYAIEAVEDGKSPLVIELECLAGVGSHNRHRISGVELGKKLNLVADGKNEGARSLAGDLALRPGFEVVGWTHGDTALKTWNPAAPSVVSFNRTSVSVGKDRELFVVAKKTTKLALKFEPNDDKESPVTAGTMPAAQTVSSNGGVHVFRIDRSEPVRDGYVFLGWSEQAGAAPIYGPGSTVIVRERDGLYRASSQGGATVQTLYAQWAPISRFSLNFNANAAGVTGMPATQVAEGTENDLVGGAMPIKIASERPARAGYTFAGWSTTAAAESASYQPGDTVSVESATVLYAVWAQAGEAIEPGAGTGSTTVTFPEETPTTPPTTTPTAPTTPVTTTPTTTPTTVTGPGAATTTTATDTTGAGGAGDAAAAATGTGAAGDAAGAAAGDAAAEGAAGAADAAGEPIADDANPLAANAGGNDVAEASVADDEVPLASGMVEEGAEASSSPVLIGVMSALAGAAVAAAALWLFIVKRRSNKQAEGASHPNQM